MTAARVVVPVVVPVAGPADTWLAMAGPPDRQEPGPVALTLALTAARAAGGVTN